MQVSVENTGSLGRRMKVAVPAARLEQEFSNRLKRLSQTVKLPGFRPGKVPLKMVEAQYGGRLLEEIVGDLIYSTFYEAAGEQGLRPAGGPRFQPKGYARGQDVEYTAEFEIYPEIKTVKVPEGQLERVTCVVTEADVDRTLETMRKQRMNWRPMNRAAQEGDRVEIDFKGTLNGQPFEGGEAQGFSLVLGSRTLIEGFEEGLIGAHSGETRHVNVTFPSDYRNTKLAGQPVEFAITVKQVSEPVLPDLDQAFFAELGMVDVSVETLRDEIKANLEREAEERTKVKFKQQILKALLEANPVEIPDGLIQAEAARLVRITRANLEAQGTPPERLPSDTSLFAGQARERVALGLVLAEFVKAEGIKAEPAEVRARLEQLAASYDAPQEFIKWHYSSPERLSEIESLVLEDRAVERIVSKVKTSDKFIGFQELLAL